MKLRTHVIVVRRYDGTPFVRGLAKQPITLLDDEALIEVNIGMSRDDFDALFEKPPNERRLSVSVTVGWGEQ